LQLAHSGYVPPQRYPSINRSYLAMGMYVLFIIIIIITGYEQGILEQDGKDWGLGSLVTGSRVDLELG
jgi:hypothetical protein